MSRWLKHLTSLHLIVGDGSGDLDDDLTLSGLGMARMEEVLCRAGTLKDQFLPNTRIAN
jgi:hypothetical protein